MRKTIRVSRVRVPNGTIGVVVANVGAPPEPGALLARYVECDYFQDIRHHTDLFEVITAENLGDGLTAADLREVDIGFDEVGVVIVNTGAVPDPESPGRVVPGHRHFQWPWVFLARGGQQGVQAETLPEGRGNTINPWFARVVRISTRAFVLTFSEPARDAGGSGAGRGGDQGVDEQPRRGDRGAWVG